MIPPTAKHPYFTVPPVTKQPQPWAPLSLWKALSHSRCLVFFGEGDAFHTFFFFFAISQAHAYFMSQRWRYLSCRLLCIRSGDNPDRFHRLWKTAARLHNAAVHVSETVTAVKVGKMGHAAKKCATASLKFRFHSGRRWSCSPPETHRHRRFMPLKLKEHTRGFQMTFLQLLFYPHRDDHLTCCKSRDVMFTVRVKSLPMWEILVVLSKNKAWTDRKYLFSFLFFKY